MSFDYPMSGTQLYVFVGRLRESVELVEEVNKLHWMSVDSDLFDMNKFAGEGNIGHMIEQINIYGERVFE